MIKTKLLTLTLMCTLGLVACRGPKAVEQAPEGTSQTLNKSTYEPCGGKACGDLCTICDPTDASCVESAVVKQCGVDGSCLAQQALCEPKSVYQPCEGKACGDSCTSCDPNDANCVESAVVKLCGADGSCLAQKPVCGTTYKPCDGKKVGDACTQCDPSVPDCVETAVLKVCKADGSCGS